MKLKFGAGAALAVLTLGVTLAAALTLPAYAQKPTAPASAHVKAETVQFMRTHSWNEETSTWVDMPARKAKM